MRRSGSSALCRAQCCLSAENKEPRGGNYYQFRDKDITDVPAYSDTLRTRQKCHCKQIVTLNRGYLVPNDESGNCQKCHCSQIVTVTGVTVRTPELKETDRQTGLSA